MTFAAHLRSGWLRYPAEPLFSAVSPVGIGEEGDWAPTMRAFHGAASERARAALPPLAVSLEALRTALVEEQPAAAREAAACVGAAILRLLASHKPAHQADRTAHELRLAAREVLLDLTRLWRALDAATPEHASAPSAAPSSSCTTRGSRPG